MKAFLDYIAVKGTHSDLTKRIDAEKGTISLEYDGYKDVEIKAGFQKAERFMIDRIETLSKEMIDYVNCVILCWIEPSGL